MQYLTNHASSNGSISKGNTFFIIVTKAGKTSFTVTEGNKNNAVGDRSMQVNGRYIRGFVTPKYDGDGTTTKEASKKKDEKRAYEYGFWVNYRNQRRVLPSVVVINYDLMWRRQELLQLHDFTLMLDESSLIQNHGTKRTRFVLRMKPAAVILLSGTPTSGRYERLWTQMHLLGWPISRKLYEQTYVIWDYIENYQTGYKIPVVKDYKNVARLKEKMKEYGCIFMKTEEFGIDLPDQQDIKIRIPASSDYKKFMKTRVIEVDGKELVGDTSLTARLYARQLCGQYSAEKLSAVSDLIASTEDRLDHLLQLHG